MSPNTVPRAATGARRLRRIAAAGGSMMMAGGALVAGDVMPAAADHDPSSPGGHGDHIRVPNRNFDVCGAPNTPGTNETNGVNWGLAQLTRTGRIDVSQCRQRKNVLVNVGNYPEAWWWGYATCSNVSTFPNCSPWSIRFNRPKIDNGIINGQSQFSNPAAERPAAWRFTACHEFGHAAGLGHRKNTNSCMANGWPVSDTFDSHDQNAIRANYP